MLHKQLVSNNRLKELEARERKIVQELKTIVQEETAKTELGYNQQTLEDRELKLNQERTKLTETVQKFYQDSTLTKNNQQDISEALSKNVGRLEREFENLKRQKATYQEWKENYKAVAKTMPLDEQIKKYGKNPRCKQLLAELKQVREDKLAILTSCNKEINRQSSKESGWGMK
ncbi:MAG TPA: hypothetical protein PLH87_11260 [Bacillota bacterium]|nr:hypothetical protein [Bacillota bacterium]